jgi:hypothetical protein
MFNGIKTEVENNYDRGDRGGDRGFGRSGRGGRGGRGGFRNGDDSRRGERNGYDRRDGTDRRDGNRRDFREDNNRSMNKGGPSGFMERYNNEGRQTDNLELEDLCQKFRNLFNITTSIYKALDRYELCKLLKNRNSKITVFEIMNYIHSQNIIEKELRNGYTFEPKGQLEQNIFSSFKPENKVVYDVIENYKTYPAKDEFDMDGYKNTGEMRRKIKFSTAQGYNYLPVLCKEVESCSKGEKCRYAHTNNEIQFHPLKYKTSICFRQCDNIYCPFAKDGNELRVIYNGEDEDTIKLCLEVEAFLKDQKIYKSYQELFQYPTEFDLNTFKIKECRGGCNLDYHLCLNAHHSASELRRPQNIFFYSPQICKEGSSASEFCRKYVNIS